MYHAEWNVWPEFLLKIHLNQLGLLVLAGVKVFINSSLPQSLTKLVLSYSCVGQSGFGQ